MRRGADSADWSAEHLPWSGSAPITLSDVLVKLIRHNLQQGRRGDDHPAVLFGNRQRDTCLALVRPGSAL